VEGGEPGAQRQVLADMKPLEGKPVSSAATLDALKPIQSNGGYGATYETFGPATAPAVTPGPANPEAAGPDTGVLVRLTKDPIGPPYLLVGPDLAAETSNITRAELDLRFVDQNLGGFGSELRATAQLGYRTDLSAEYYRLMTPSGFFLEPRTGIVASRCISGPTRSVSPSASSKTSTPESRLAALSAIPCKSPPSGALRIPTGASPLAPAAALISPEPPRRGCSTSTSTRNLPAQSRPRLPSGSLRRRPLSRRRKRQRPARHDLHCPHLVFERAQYFRPHRGCQLLSPRQCRRALPIHARRSSPSFRLILDEFRGTDTYLARAGYLRRLAALPTGLGQGLYGIIGYEAGEIWSPEAHAILRQDGTAGLVAATPFGAISIGGSVGDAGHRKVFITLGRLF